MREANGLTLKDAAEYLQRDLSMISRFETGVYPIRRGDFMALIDLYGVEEARQREILLQLATEVCTSTFSSNGGGNCVEVAVVAA
ncbi:helix-turn-helix domain-containing protein [Actinoallomurus purpureus]|nr:helix-turn-helix domain-containing protein [Actinoallomurus purpureus]